MNDIEYIIRVVLKARDDMRGKLGAAAAEIRGLDAAADGLDKRLDNVNKKVTSFNTRVNNLGATLKKVREGDATLDDVLKDITKSEQDLEHASKSATAALGDQHQIGRAHV